LNPKLYEAHYFYGRTSFQQAKFAEAVQHFEEASRVRPEDYQAAMLISMPYSGLGRQAEAQAALRHGLQVIEKHLELNPDDVRALYLGGIALAQVGERERALDWAARALALDSEDSGVLYNVACVKALAGLKEEGFVCLEKAIRNGFGHREWLENDSDLESLREDPRFQVLLNRL
jgi:Flp pilus assembly protein TadD